eukprot:m.13804 g.13804  ORF g.13804 m.13804 type:complete len:102 (-) comp8557_c0_seq1:161-466(-)
MWFLCCAAVCPYKIAAAGITIIVAILSWLGVFESKDPTPENDIDDQKPSLLYRGLYVLGGGLVLLLAMEMSFDGIVSKQFFPSCPHSHSHSHSHSHGLKAT